VVFDEDERVTVVANFGEYPSSERMSASRCTRSATVEASLRRG
jgi:hypothetical protein